MSKQMELSLAAGSMEPQINMIAKADGAAAAVNISENLPPLYKEIWLEEDGLDEKFFSDKDVFHLAPSEPVTGQEQFSDEGDRKRWGILMKKLTNIENNTSSLSKDLNDLSVKVQANSEQTSNSKKLILKNEQKISELNQRYNTAWGEVDRNMNEQFCAMKAALQEENEAFRAKVMEEAERKVERIAEQKAKEVTKDLQDEITQEKYDSRKINLLILGIAETEKEDTGESVNSFISKRMAISGVKVDIAYRLGKEGSNKPRPILAKFKEMAHRNKVWFSKSKISQEDGRAWIQEDLPKAVKNSYRTFFRILRKAKSMGDRFPNAHIKGQSLFIDGKPYGEDNLEQLPEVLRPSSLATMHSDGALIFFGRFSPLSNHHFSRFTIDGTEFSCMEQYIAWSRATHAGNHKLTSRALKQADPVFYKGILNELKANKTNDPCRAATAEQWYEQLDVVVGRGLRAKFQQNPALAHYLCKTHPKVLGEACPDTRWGIGFTLVDPSALDIEKWPARGNVMGRQLSIIRNELLADKNA